MDETPGGVLDNTRNTIIMKLIISIIVATILAVNFMSANVDTNKELLTFVFKSQVNACNKLAEANCNKSN